MVLDRLMMARPIRCLLSAGPTREFFDPVRYVSNPSSGKMGYALAHAALKAGWEVDLVSGPVSLPPPPGARVVRVVTGEEMYRAIDELFGRCDILIMTAALIDFRPKEKAPEKVKKDALHMSIEMEPVVDILATMGRRKKGQMIVGFAAETNNVEDYARRKIDVKNADFIVANRIGVPDSGFESDDNHCLLLGRGGGREELGPAPKTLLGEILIQRFAAALEARQATPEAAL
jgi:phosphopantothenoylcysteine decarboxylase/phosphopantothenate--cysteine ligase